MVEKGAIAGARDHTAITHNDATDRDLAAAAGRARLFERQVHE
jgi:hypothetical protein